MNRSRTVLVMVTTFGIALGSSAAAQPRRGAPPAGPPPAGQRLQLTAEQREAIRKLVEQDRPATPAEQVRRLQRQLHDLVMADAPDTGRIEALKKEIGAVQAKMLADRVNRQLQIAKILTPEQRKLLRDRPGALRRFLGRGAGPGFGPGRGWGSGLGRGRGPGMGRGGWMGPGMMRPGPRRGFLMRQRAMGRLLWQWWRGGWGPGGPLGPLPPGPRFRRFEEPSAP